MCLSNAISVANVISGLKQIFSNNVCLMPYSVSIFYAGIEICFQPLRILNLSGQFRNEMGLFYGKKKDTL